MDKKKKAENGNEISRAKGRKGAARPEDFAKPWFTRTQ
jgi:hypothetical protein